MKFVGAHIFSYDATFRGDVTIEGNLTVSNSVSQTISFGDNDKLKFGDGNDLEIFHDGSNSYINQRNTGNLIIQASSADKDIILKSDDGSGSATAYLTLDGSHTRTKFDKKILVADGEYVGLGDGADLQIMHNGTNTLIDNTTGDVFIRQFADNKDIKFSCDDGSGGTTTYFYLDGSEKEIRVNEEMQFEDNVKLNIGTGEDLTFKHDGSNTFITNDKGNLTITNNQDDGDIIFKSDDQSGGTTTYFTVDGSTGYVRFEDNRRIAVGSSDDLHILHDGNDNYIKGETGDLHIRNDANDKDIVLSSDDGSGNVTPYLTIDGSDELIDFSKGALFNTGSYLKLNDNITAFFGTGNDLRIHHDGSNSYISQEGTGDLYIRNTINSRDIYFQSDDGSGGNAIYFYLDGSAERTIFSKSIVLSDSVEAIFGTGLDFKIKHTSVNTELENNTGNLTFINNADDKDIKFFCDDGSGGVTAYLTLDGGLGYTTVQKKIRFNDNVNIEVGTGSDLRIAHDGSNTAINNVTGDLTITNYADDKDVIFQTDNGSGGVTSYIQLDGSDLSTKILTQKLIISNLPTSDPGVDGQVWNNSGVLNISAGG